MAVPADEAQVNEGGRRSGVTLYALFVIAGLIALGYSWMTVQHRLVPQLSAATEPIWAHNVVTHWIDHGYFASHGLLWPTAEGKTVYRSGTGALMLTSFVAEKVWIGMTGRYGWRLRAIHNLIVAVLISALLALLAYRLARRFGAAPPASFILAVSAQMVWLTFPDNLALFWQLTAQSWCLAAALLFLLLEEAALDGRRTRRITILQGVAFFAFVYFEFVLAAMFAAAWLATVFLLRGERPPLRRLAFMLFLPGFLAMSIYGLQLIGARSERSRGVTVVGSGFLYRTGLDGDAMFYGDPLDIAFGRDLVRAQRGGNKEFLFRWEALFFAGAAAMLVMLAAYLRGRVPRIAIVILMTLLGTYLLHAAVFSQLVALHPYLFDVLLMTPLVLALFVMLPALFEVRTGETGLIILIVLFAAAWTSMFQLRLYALAYPAPQPAAVLAAPNGGRP
ncbi:MAG: hypothetical protein QOE68_1094 [Thermoanaerobaculia bacterium]|jgi:hypothetical protein|nr:hypothetical protein [Thermoanaerobaculia bacterium]